MKPLVINAISSYSKVPVSTSILSESLPLLHTVLPIGEREIYFLIDENQQELVDNITAQFGKDIHVVPIDGDYGFFYQNSAAVAKILRGERPLPGWKDESIELCTVEDLLYQEHKRVAIDTKKTELKQVILTPNVSVKEVLSAFGNTTAKAICFGYPMGIIVDTHQEDIQILLATDYITVIQEDDCMLDCLLDIVKHYENQCCGKCVFGYEGLTQIYTILHDITQKKGKATDIDLLIDLSQVMKSQSLCEIGKSAAGVVLSAIAHFRGELEAHITKKTCAAGVCGKFITYHILQDLCTGCGKCMDECEDDAILGKKKFIHVIDTEECIQCGKCLVICPENAIVTAGANKPKCPKKPVPCKK